MARITNEMVMQFMEEMRADMKSMRADIDALKAGAVGAPSKSGKQGKKSEKSEKSESEFVKHMKKLHERTDAEKAQAKADWHSFFDPRWEAWRNSDEYKALKKSERSEANKRKNAEICAEWKAQKK